MMNMFGIIIICESPELKFVVFREITIKTSHLLNNKLNNKCNSVSSTC